MLTVSEAGLLSENERGRGTGLASVFLAEELAPAFAALEWKTPWQSHWPGGYSAQSQLCIGQEPSAERL